MGLGTGWQHVDRVEIRSLGPSDRAVDVAEPAIEEAFARVVGRSPAPVVSSVLVGERPADHLDEDRARMGVPAGRLVWREPRVLYEDIRSAVLDRPRDRGDANPLDLVVCGEEACGYGGGIDLRHVPR